MIGKRDLVIRSANITTMDPLLPFAEAMAIREGRIVDIGQWPEVEPQCEGMTVLDLKGRTVVPGMIDTHVHFLWTALSEAALDVSAAQDHETLAAILRTATAALPEGEAIVGMGYTEYALDTAEHGPIIETLDAASPDRPVYLLGVSGHSSAANTRSLELLALPEDTPGLLCGEDGSPNGLLINRANSEAQADFSELFGLDKKAWAAIPAAIQRAHSVGITTIHALEGFRGEEGDPVVDRFWAAMPNLPLRFVLYYQTLDVDKVVELGLPRIGGCIMLDGDLEPHTAALSEPYNDDPDCYGTLYFSQKRIDAFVLDAHRAGLQIALHAVGDAAVEQALNAYEAALETHPREDHRHRIEHCTVIREDQIRRAQRLEVALGIQPAFNLYWPYQDSIPSLGEARARQVDSVRRLLRPNLLVAGGSDSFVTPLGPLLGVHAAVNHSSPMERVSVHQALQLYTTNAARIAFQEDDRGSLEEGKLGDFVVLGEDPYEIDPHRLKEVAVEMTVIGGEIVYQR